MNGCGFGYDDAAYLLGALTPTDRAAYERHLPGCVHCRTAVAELSGLPALLARLDPATLPDSAGLSNQPAPVGLVAPLAGPAGPAGPAEPVGPAEPARPAGTAAELLLAASRTRRRQRIINRWRYAGGIAAAAAIALVVGYGLSAIGTRDNLPGPGPEASVHMVAMAPVRDPVPVRAEIGLRKTNWGTEITMHCSYRGRPGSRPGGAGYPYVLIAYGRGGAREQVGSWVGSPDGEVRFQGTTQFTAAELVRLEIVRSDGTALLGSDVP